jgi:hypothetical protein
MVDISSKSSERDQENFSSRRTFLKQAAAATLAISGPGVFDPGTDAAHETITGSEIPWYRRVTRWGQTNITEKDPLLYDINWWRSHWKRTGTQGVIVNAGGIIAYYPTEIPFHYQAKYLGGRDLFGELCRAAHEDGIVVFARMDSNRAHEDLYKAHPDWFAIDSGGKPYRASDLYITCVNSPYYNEHVPSILTEIAVKYRPEGFTDNSWSGLGRDSICYCDNCRKSFREKTGKEIPLIKDWDNPVYRLWIRWNYDRRLEIWNLNNHTTRAAGGPYCIWAGMNSGSVSNQSRSFRDYREICRRADIIMLDHQSRSDSTGFQGLSDVGKLVHGISGWDKLVPDSMAMYQAGRPTFRVSSKPVYEARMWMIEGFAGGIQPWWHHISAYHEDRRMYHTAEPVYHWYRKNEMYLINRLPVCTVGVVWSQENTDYYGRDQTDLLVDSPWTGITQALIRARIPYVPVHANDIERDASELSLLILPNLGSLTKSQTESIQRFVENGGSLFATGESSLYDEAGTRLKDYALSGILGAHIKAGNTSSYEQTFHTYLRLYPQMISQVYGPKTGKEPPVTGTRHPVLKGFELTDILPFGGNLNPLIVNDDSSVIMTFIPEFPIYPPETAWMREPETNIPGLILRTLPNGSRVAFMPADLDRQFARYNLPDHGDLIRNIILWASNGNIPLKVEGPGLIDCNLYHQQGRLILHLSNLTSAGTWRTPVHEYIPVGPLTVKVKLTDHITGENLNLLVADKNLTAEVIEGWSIFTINSILDHEVVVLT